MLVKVPATILNLPWFQLGRRYKEDSYSLENENMKFTCSAGERLPSWGEMDLILFLCFQRQKQEYTFSMKDCLQFLGKKDSTSVLKSLRNLAKTTYWIRKDNDQVFNLIKLEESGNTKGRFYTFFFKENIFDDSFQMIDIKKYLSLPAGYTRRFFLYLERYRRLKKSYLKLKDIEFWACLLAGDERKHHKQVRRTLNRLSNAGFLNKVEEDNLKHSYKVFYAEKFHSSSHPEVNEFSQVVTWEDAERLEKKKLEEKQANIGTEEKDKSEDSEKQTEIHDFVEDSNISLEEKLSMFEKFEEEDVTILDDIAKRKEEKQKLKEEQEKQTRKTELTPEQIQEKLDKMPPEERKIHIRALKIKKMTAPQREAYKELKDRKAKEKFLDMLELDLTKQPEKQTKQPEIEFIPKRPKTPADRGEMDAIPRAWDKDLEEHYQQMRKTFCKMTREYYFRVYAPEIFEQRKYAQQQCQEQGHREGNNVIDFGVKDEKKFAPTYADKMAVFEEKYPVLTMAQIQAWFNENLNECIYNAQQLLQKHKFNEQEFCEYVSKHLIPSFYSRKESKSPVTVRIAMKKMALRERFDFII